VNLYFALTFLIVKLSVGLSFKYLIARTHDHSVFAGPMGFVMAFAVAALGLKTAVSKQGFLSGTPQVI